MRIGNWIGATLLVTMSVWVLLAVFVRLVYLFPGPMLLVTVSGVSLVMIGYVLWQHLGREN